VSCKVSDGHSALDAESSCFKYVWIPASAGMTRGAGMSRNENMNDIEEEEISLKHSFEEHLIND
jgi:hypothetical protein